MPLNVVYFIRMILLIQYSSFSCVLTNHQALPIQKKRAVGGKLYQQLHSWYYTWEWSWTFANATQAMLVPQVSCPVAQNICMWIPWVLGKHTNSWAPLHPEGIIISAGGVQKSILNTLFRQFLFTGKSESEWTQNGPQVIHIVSSPLKKNKGLASDSDPRD